MSYSLYQQVSAFASAFVDNIPLTTMMVKIAIGLAENEALDLPLKPLVWALALGACLGGIKVSSQRPSLIVELILLMCVFFQETVH